MYTRPDLFTALTSVSPKLPQTKPTKPCHIVPLPPLPTPPQSIQDHATSCPRPSKTHSGARTDTSSPADRRCKPNHKNPSPRREHEARTWHRRCLAAGNAKPKELSQWVVWRKTLWRIFRLAENLLDTHVCPGLGFKSLFHRQSQERDQLTLVPGQHYHKETNDLVT